MNETRIDQHSYLPIGPLAGEVNAETSDYSRLVLEAHCRQVQTGKHNQKRHDDNRWARVHTESEKPTF